MIHTILVAVNIDVADEGEALREAKNLAKGLCMEGEDAYPLGTVKAFSESIEAKLAELYENQT